MNNNRKRISVWIVTALLSMFVFSLSQFTSPGVVIQIIIYSLFPGGPLSFFAVGWITSIAVIIYSIRKHKKMYLSLVIAILMTIASLNVLVWRIRDDARMARMRTLQQEIDRHLVSEGKFPANMKENQYFTALSPGPFGIDVIEYLRTGQDYKLSSCGVPIGPFDVYDSKSKEWYNEE